MSQLIFIVINYSKFEYSRKDYEKGRFTLVFLCAPEDKELASNSQKPLLELTYNWDLEDIRGWQKFWSLSFVS